MEKREKETTNKTGKKITKEDINNHDGRDPRRDALIGTIAVSLFAVALILLIISWPKSIGIKDILLIGSITIITEGLFLAGIANARKRAIECFTRITTKVFDMGMLAGGAGAIVRSNPSSDSTKETLQKIISKLSDIKKEAMALANKLPWYLEISKGGLLVGEAIVLGLSIASLFAPPITVLGVLGTIIGALSLIATIYWILDQLSDDSFERGKIAQKEEDLEELRRDLEKKQKSE